MAATLARRQSARSSRRYESTRTVDPHAGRIAASVESKEMAVGALCGTALGLLVFAVGVATRIVSVHVGAVVAISLPLVSSSIEP